MELEMIQLWLKSTILGVIILGALGSILALALIKALRSFYRLIVFGKGAFKKREYNKGFVTGIVVGYLDLKRDPIVAISYFSLKVARLVIALTVFLSALAVFLFVLPMPDGTVLTAGSFLSIIICFLALRWAYEQFRDFLSAFNHFVKPLADELTEQYKKPTKETADDS